jgi:hypothetical protein
VLTDIRTLRNDAAAMRDKLARGGSAPPTPIEDLLSGRDTARIPSASPPGG